MRSGAIAGLKPQEIWDLELWEYNTWISAYEEKRRQATAEAIMTGYYAAYYTNGGKKAKSPNELIKKLYAKKQSLEAGLQDIERLRATEKRGTKNGESRTI